jgi:cytochrome P450
MTDSQCPSVSSWASDFDHGSQEYADDPYSIFEGLRRSGCPIAHTERYGNVWIPVTYDIIKQISLDTKNFSSEGTIVQKKKPYQENIFLKKSLYPVGILPPISSDPPFHKIARDLLAPIFSPDAVALWQEEIEAACQSLIVSMKDSKSSELMEHYCNKVPSIIIAKMLGIPDYDIDKFDDWIYCFIHMIEEVPNKKRLLTYLKYQKYMTDHINSCIENPKDDVIGHLLKCQIYGEPITTSYLLGVITLLLVAGVYTISSAMGSSLWYLATNSVDRRRLVENPDMIPTAVEEFLRAYAPLAIARLVKEDMEFQGVQMKKEDWVLIPVAAANRDDKHFENANEVIIDRKENHHAAFGFGIHHCLGEHLARLEITTAIKVFLQSFQDFTLDQKENVVWSTGQIRGPLKLSVIF